MLWLRDRFGVKLEGKRLFEHDGYLEIELAEPFDMRVLAARPAHWELERVYKELLCEFDCIVLMLNKIDTVRRLNAEIVALVKPVIESRGITPVVIVNDSHGGDPRFPSVSAENVRSELGLEWPVHDATIGPFERKLRWEAGAEEAWGELLRQLNRPPA